MVCAGVGCICIKERENIFVRVIRRKKMGRRLLYRLQKSWEITVRLDENRSSGQLIGLCLLWGFQILQIAWRRCGEDLRPRGEWEGGVLSGVECLEDDVCRECDQDFYSL